MIEYPSDEELRAAARDTSRQLWRGRDTPSVWVMQPVEALAEKILGWCAHDMAKHYVDAAWIVAENEDPESGVKFKYPKLREALGDKLALMSALQPSYYQELPSVDAVVGRLNNHRASTPPSGISSCS